MLDRDRSQSAMGLRVISARNNPHLTTATTTTLPPGAGGPDRDAADNGSKDESFFEARPWLDSDSDDDFYSVRGDFTPSRGSTPDHHNHQRRTTQFSGRMPVVDRSTKPSLVERKQRLLDLLQEKQHYDDEDDDDDSATDISSSHMENSTVVHAEEHLNSRPARKGAKAKKSSKSSGCFPNLIWKHGFKMCRNMDKEHKKPK